MQNCCCKSNLLKQVDRGSGRGLQVCHVSKNYVDGIWNFYWVESWPRSTMVYSEYMYTYNKGSLLNMYTIIMNVNKHTTCQHNMWMDFVINTTWKINANTEADTVWLV